MSGLLKTLAPMSQVFAFGCSVLQLNSSARLAKSVLGASVFRAAR